MRDEALFYNLFRTYKMHSQLLYHFLAISIFSILFLGDLSDKKCYGAQSPESQLLGTWEQVGNGSFVRYSEGGVVELISDSLEQIEKRNWRYFHETKNIGIQEDRINGTLVEKDRIRWITNDKFEITVLFHENPEFVGVKATFVRNNSISKTERLNICFSKGIYSSCRAGGFGCIDQTVTGVGVGIGQVNAANKAIDDCGVKMMTFMAVAQGSTSIKRSCDVQQCLGGRIPDFPTLGR